MFVQNAWQRLPALIPVVLLSLAFPPAPRRIAPQFTFGSRREKVSKRDSTPAPGVYKTEGAMGPQHMSNRTNASAISFGESKRPPLSLTSTTVGPGEVCAHASYLTPPPPPPPCKHPSSLLSRPPSSRRPPLPLQYALKSTMGTQSVSTIRSKPMFSFGSAPRPNPNAANSSSAPGPGQYKLGSGSIGTQWLSNAKTAPQARLAGRERFGSTYK